MHSVSLAYFAFAVGKIEKKKTDRKKSKLVIFKNILDSRLVIISSSKTKQSETNCTYQSYNLFSLSVVIKIEGEKKDRRIYKEQQITNFNSPDNSQVIIFQEDFLLFLHCFPDPFLERFFSDLTSILEPKSTRNR